MVHIHAEGPAFFCWIPKLFGKRVICTIHGLDWDREKWRGSVASKFIRGGEKNAVKYADEIIVLSKDVQKYFLETYGKEGFKAVHEYLVNGGKSCMAGFVLKNTLSDNGGVTRGICKMDDQNNLTEVVETKNIVKTATGAEADGVAVDVNSLVSMNMWGLRLGTFQLSDLFYNTVGGMIGGLMYYGIAKAKKHL